MKEELRPQESCGILVQVIETGKDEGMEIWTRSKSGKTGVLTVFVLGKRDRSLDPTDRRRQMLISSRSRIVTVNLGIKEGMSDGGDLSLENGRHLRHLVAKFKWENTG